MLSAPFSDDRLLFSFILQSWNWDYSFAHCLIFCLLVRLDCILSSQCTHFYFSHPSLPWTHQQFQKIQLRIFSLLIEAQPMTFFFFLLVHICLHISHFSSLFSESIPLSIMCGFLGDTLTARTPKLHIFISFPPPLPISFNWWHSWEYISTFKNYSTNYSTDFILIRGKTK